MTLRFDALARSGTTRARVGRVRTPHGEFQTPAFMPVGTRGTVRGILPPMLARTGSQILLANTYHLLVRPGPQTVEALGGLHRFMGWNGPILTDSGGYQAFSLAHLRSLDDDGVTFQSHVDGSDVRLTPEAAMRVQNLLGADIVMPLDDCPPAAPDAGRVRVEESVARTTRWLERCVRAHARPDAQALFGIVQGGTHPDLRERSAREVTALDLPGYAIGGVAVGEEPEVITRVVGETAGMLPQDRPRYLMGLGYERDLVAAVRAGVDLFDCVLPTRNGRNATVFTRAGPLRLRNARHRNDPAPIEPDCDCPACRPGDHGWETPGEAPISRGYMRHLFASGEMLGPILASLHNVRYFQRLMLDIRRAIREDDWLGLSRRWPTSRPDHANHAAGPGA
jgi:queuine tRNA-ribosyltransferase